jgi:hypothetical protein
VSGPYPQVLLKHRKPDRITTLAEYRQADGYKALQRVLSRWRYGGHQSRTR